MPATYKDSPSAGTVDSSNKVFTYDFPALQTEDVKVALNGVTQATTKYTVDNTSSPTKITFNNTSIDSNVQESSGAPKTGVTVRVYRETTVGKLTGDEDPKAVFAAGSSVRASDLNNNQEQVCFGIHELQEQPFVSSDIEDGAITSAKIQDGTIVNVDINASAAIAGTKVSPNFGSQAVSTSGTLAAGATTVTGNITVSGTVDGRDVATDGSKLDGIEAGATGNQTNAEIRAAVEAASDSNVFTDADHSKLNSIEASATADQDAAEIRALVESASDSNVFTDADHSKLNAIAASADVTDATNVNAAGAVMNSDTTTASMQFVVDEDNFASDSNTKVPTQQSTKAYIASYGTSAHQPLDNELTTLAGMQSGTASILASGTALTSTTAELNLLDGKSIVTSVSGSSTDVQLPTAKAVNDQIVNLLNDTGGFKPIANEVSFPTTNPDPDDGAGTIVSIADAGGLKVADGSGSGTYAGTAGHSIGATTTAGVAVTITDIDTSLRGTTIAAGKGMLVQTTTTLNEYTYHRLVVDEAGVGAAQTLVSDFNQRYRVGSSNPTSPVADGDLFFNTSSNKMLVYNASDSSWDDVQSVGNYFINTISSLGASGDTIPGGSATPNGVAKKFTLSNAGTYAEQHIVSINGVIQKPNSGTSVPSEGFAIDGSTIIFSDAPPTGSDYFIITIGAAVNIGTPGNNTVSTASIQNLAVNSDKLGADAVIGSKIADDAVDTEHLADNSVTTAAIAANAVARELIANDAINGAKIADDAVGAEHIEVLDAALQFGDSVKAQFGAGNDLEIYHDGSNSYIHEGGDGGLYIRGSILGWRDAGNSNQSWINANAGEGVELYFNGTKKFETTSEGSKAYGIFRVEGAEGADGKLLIQADDGDDSDDFTRLRHGADGYFYIENYASGSYETALKSDGNGSVELYYDNSKKFETESGGARVTGDLTVTTGNSILTNSSQGQLTVKGGATYPGGAIKFAGGQSGATDQGTIIFYAGTDTSLETRFRIQADGRVQIPNDSGKYECGSSGDLKIYHNGTNSYINNNAGPLYIETASTEISLIKGTYASGEWMLRAINDGAVELYYDGTRACYTASNALKFDDNKQAIFGGQLKQWHSGSHSFIENGAGNLYIYSKDGHDGHVVIQATYGEESIICEDNGAVKLYYDNSQKAYTYSEGWKVNGYIKALADLSDAHGGDNVGDYHTLQSSSESNSTLLLEHSGNSTPRGIYAYFSDAAPDNATQYFLYCEDSSALRAKINSNGSFESADNSYGGISDIKLKENIVDANSQWNDIKALKIRNFNFKRKPDTKLLGVVAQEVETISPGIVYESEDLEKGGVSKGTTTKGVKYSILYMKAIKALQEAMEKIETLETKVAALEAK